MAEHYTSFSDLIQNCVLPLQRKHSEWIRLDGNVSGGNRNVFATFRYKFKDWKIHSDTTFEALLTAWKLESEGKSPFVLDKTPKGTPCLRLPDSLDEEANGLYIYLK